MVIRSPKSISINSKIQDPKVDSSSWCFLLENGKNECKTSHCIPRTEPWCQAVKCLHVNEWDLLLVLEYNRTVTKTAHQSLVLALSVKTSSHKFSGNIPVFSITKLSKGSGSKPPCNEVWHLFVVESSCDYWLWLFPFDVHDVNLLSIQPSWISIHTDTDCGFISLLGDGRRWSLWLLHAFTSSL